MKNNKNSKQDVAIARLEEKFNAFEKRFDDFTNNHFKALKKKVDWILYLTITSLISIIIKILFF